MSRAATLLSLAMVALPLAACSEDGVEGYPPLPGLDGGRRFDAAWDSLFVDRGPDGVVVPDAGCAAGGPVVEVQQLCARNGTECHDVTAAGEPPVLVGGVVLARVRARVSERPVTSVTVRVCAGRNLSCVETQARPLSADTENQEFEAALGMEGVGSGESGRVQAIAADQSGGCGEDSAEFVRDAGPVITVLLPEEATVVGGPGLATVTLLLSVESPRWGATEPSVRLGRTEIPVSPAAAGTWTGVIPLGPPTFPDWLVGEQLLVVEASSDRPGGQTTRVEHRFSVDRQGPRITRDLPEPGSIVGGVMTVRADVVDGAGVVAESVVATIGNGVTTLSTVPLELERGDHTDGTWSGRFDTRLLPQNVLYPSISLRARDRLGNESATVGYLVALDNVPPLLSLDPPEIRVGRREDSGVYCTGRFDPLGVPERVASDGRRYPGLFYVKARIEDRGNGRYVVGEDWDPVSLVDPASVKVYVQGNAGAGAPPLVVRRLRAGDGERRCNDLNPELRPTSVGGTDVVAIDMVPIAPSGSPDYRVPPTHSFAGWTFEGAPCTADLGADEEEFLCDIAAHGTLAIGYTVDGNEPSIWTIGPVSTGLTCAGLPFDPAGSSIPAGWACIAVAGADREGNFAVSAPIRVCIGSDPTLCPGFLTGDRTLWPTCRGIYDETAGGVVPGEECTLPPADELPFHDEIGFARPE